MHDREIAAAVIVVSLVLFSVAVVTLWWMMHAWRTPQTLAATKFAAPDGAFALSFSLLIPARHEQNVLGLTVERLLESTHTEYEIIIIVGHDDPETSRTAIQLATRAPDRVRVVTDSNEVKTKPKALNTALPHCRGDIVGVFDAEDQVHPELLAHVDHAFRARGADVVQGGVQLVNYHSSWYSLRNCLEYFFWFHSRLHLHAQKGFIPLGGNTVFVRTELLRQAGGWDPDCLAEDCDLGVRLSSQGARMVVAYDSLIVTREETPDSLYGLFKQRTRWNQGFLQVFRKKDWRRLPTLNQRMLARYTLATPFLQAFAGIAIPVGIGIGVFLPVPVAFVLRFRVSGSGQGRTRIPERLGRRIAVAAGAAAAAAYIVPLWYGGDHLAVTADPNADYTAAANWIHAHLADPRHTKIVVDDALWPDMVRDGFRPGLGAIWFYKVDLDPAVKWTLPDGWRDIGYIVSSPTIRQDTSNLPTVRAALAHSRVLAVFGTGSDRIEIRRIAKGES